MTTTAKKTPRINVRIIKLGNGYGTVRMMAIVETRRGLAYEMTFECDPCDVPTVEMVRAEWVRNRRNFLPYNCCR